MELPINPSDDVLESLVTRQEREISEAATSSALSPSESRKPDVDPILKWIEKKELFISLEREEDAQQTEQALAILPLKVRFVPIGAVL